MNTDLKPTQNAKSSTANPSSTTSTQAGSGSGSLSETVWGVSKRNWPTLVTVLRIIACVPFVASYLALPSPMRAWICTVIFVLAALSDWIDGHLARKWKAQSNLGKFLDPVADKVLVLCVLILLVNDGLIHPILPILILSRDIIIGGIRSVAAADQLVIDAKATGKWKTAVQMIAVPFVLIGNEVTTWFEPFLAPSAPTLEQVGSGLLWISAVLSLISGWEYIQIYRQSRVGRP